MQELKPKLHNMGRNFSCNYVQEVEDFHSEPFRVDDDFL